MRTLLVAILLLAIPFMGIAGTTGKVAGKVVDAKTKEPLIGANILLEGTTLGAATDIEGNYVILNVPPGGYTVRAQFVGYQPVIVTGVQVSIDLTTRVDVELNEAAVEMEVVVVEARRDAIKKDVTSSQSLVSAQQIEALPVSEFDDILQLQAGVTRDADGAFHIRGGRTTEIAYWVNGISITDAYDNSRGIQIDNQSVQELQVISGTFNAEYGNAMSGIVNTVTKEGDVRFHGGLTVYAGDRLSGFTDYFPHIDRFNPIASHNIQGSLSGPVPLTNNAVRFFLNGRYYYDDGYIYGERRYNVNGTRGDGAIVPMNWSRDWYAQGNFSYTPMTDVKLNLEALYSNEHFRDYNHEYRWNPDGDVQKFAESYNVTGTVTHMLSPTTFYTVKGSFFDKVFKEYLYDNFRDPRYMHPDSMRILSYAFRTKGTNLHRFFRETNTSMGKVDFTSQMTQSHLVKAGVEVKSHDLWFDDYTLEPLRVNGIEVTPFKPAVPGINQPNREKYKAQPFEFSAYLQDKIEYESVIINLGIRLDYFDSKGKVLVEPRDPNIYTPLRPEMENLTIAEREPHFYKDADSKFQVSPRFGIAYPISERGVVHFSYGHFLQVPPFQYLFNKGPYKVPNTGLNLGVWGNPNLEAQKTVMYELGFRQEFGGGTVVDATAFYRDVRDWITAGPFVQTFNLVTYSSYVNKDYANVKGITLTMNARPGANFMFDLNYTYQVAEGSNSKPEEEYEAQKGNAEPSLFLIPMDWDQNHLLNASLSYGSDGWWASLLARYGTGLPYTPTITQFWADRNITSGLPKNSRRMPSQFTLDLKVNKSIEFMGYGITFFTRIFNVLDAKVPVRVFGDTGDPEFTTEDVPEDPNRPNTVSEYRKYPHHFGEPRNIQLGFEFSF